MIAYASADFAEAAQVEAFRAARVALTGETPLSRRK